MVFCINLFMCVGIRSTEANVNICSSPIGLYHGTVGLSTWIYGISQGLCRALWRTKCGEGVFELFAKVQVPPLGAERRALGRKEAGITRESG